MPNEEIQKLKNYLFELGAFLSKVERMQSEMNVTVSDDFNRYLDDPERPTSSPAVLKLNSTKNSISNYFKIKEIKEMPKLKDFSYRLKNNKVHEFRYRRNGINRSFSSLILSEAKKKAMQFCRELNENEKSLAVRSDLFNPFACDYMENVKKKNVSERSYEGYYHNFKKYILTAFPGKKIKDITAFQIQSFLNGILDKGFKRTAEDCYYLLKVIFQYAFDTGVIDRNPFNVVKIPLHQRTNGQALPLDVEKQFLSNIKGNPYELNFIILLYTGCRPCELPTIEFKKDGFVTFRNMKQKNGKIEFKDIPITPMLAPYVEKIKKALPLRIPERQTSIFLKNCPGYKMYDLRHTFATRCQTCGVPQEIVGRWLGHHGGNITDSVYTHFSQNYILDQAKKVDY